MEKVIECKNITHYYGEKLIYENLNFEVEKGKVLGLLGKNGTGKTTIINILNGYLKPRSGECYLLGENIESPHARHESQNRLATGRPRATHLLHDRANREILPGLLPELETGRLLRSDGKTKSRSPSENQQHVMRPAFPGRPRAAICPRPGAADPG